MQEFRKFLSVCGCIGEEREKGRKCNSFAFFEKEGEIKAGGRVAAGKQKKI